jgi:hypothetical protein
VGSKTYTVDYTDYDDLPIEYIEKTCQARLEVIGEVKTPLTLVKTKTVSYTTYWYEAEVEEN